LKRKILAIVLGVVLFFLLAIFLLNQGMIAADNSYSDFTRFKTTEDVQAYLESYLTINQTTLPDVEALIETLKLSNCNVRTDVPEFEAITTCRVRAPEDGMNWFNHFVIQRFYDIFFHYNDNILVEIAVRDGANL
jgi:hypothetical protein